MPSPPQDPHHKTKASGKNKRKSSKDDQGRLSAEIAALLDAQSNEAQADRRERERQDRRKEFRDWFTIGLLFLAFTATAIQAWIFHGQLGEMEKVYIPIRDSAAATNRAAIATEQSIAVMQGQLDEMKQSFVTDRAYVFNSRFDRWKESVVAPGLIAHFSFNNFGRTPAILRISPLMKCIYSAKGPIIISRFPVEGLTDAAGFISEGFTIPIDKPFGPFGARLEATTEEIAQAQAGIGKYIVRP